MTFQCRENYCNKPPATLHKRKNQWSNGNKYLCNVPFSEANLRHISSLIELRREIPGKQPQQRNFLKWLLVMNNFGEHLSNFQNAYQKHLSCSFSITGALYSESNVGGPKGFSSRLLICYVKILKKTINQMTTTILEPTTT